MSRQPATVPARKSQVTFTSLHEIDFTEAFLWRHGVIIPNFAEGTFVTPVIV
jgi:hypothetical protein